MIKIVKKSSFIYYSGLEIEHIKNSKLKHSYIQIKANRVFLKTPFVSSSFVNSLLEKKIDWILEKLSTAPVKDKYDYFTEVLYLGVVKSIDSSPIFTQLQLLIERLKKSENIFKAHDLFYKKEGYTFLENRLQCYAERMSLQYKSLKLRKMKRRWGSCNSLGEITLNLYLIKYSVEIIDYVIVHELSHLIEMNHSKRFYKIVSHYFPSYREVESKMKGISLS